MVANSFENRNFMELVGRLSTHSMGLFFHFGGLGGTLPNGLPLWELESWIFKEGFEGSKLIGLKNSLHYWTLLRCRCLKWARMIHSNTYNISYDRKKGQESKCQFDFWPLKVGNLFELRACKWCATYCWKYLDKEYNFSLNLISIGGLHERLWASKVTRIPILGILGLSTWES